jgi:hypothetical protein
MFKRNPKKVPIKGEPEKKVFETVCSECGKKRPYANKTKKLCSVCVQKQAKEKAKLKREAVRKKKSETITQAKLDQITSWLIRAAFPEKCHACETPMPRKQLQCCHFVSRTKSITRYDVRNMLPGCPTCNMYTPHHVWNLGKSINRIWGENTTETLLELAGTSLKMNNNDRKEIYDIYKVALGKLESQSLSDSKKIDLMADCYYYYLCVIRKLIKQ